MRPAVRKAIGWLLMIGSLVALAPLLLALAWAWGDCRVNHWCGRLSPTLVGLNAVCVATACFGLWLILDRRR